MISKIPLRSELERKYVIEHHSQIELGREYDVAPVTIKCWLEKYDIPIRSLSEAMLPNGFKEPTKKQLERWYVKDGQTAKEIGERLGIAKSTVLNMLEKNGIERLTRIQTCNNANPGKRGLKKLYIGERKSLKEIGKILGVASPTVARWLGEYDISIRSIAEVRMAPGVKRPCNEELERWYASEGRTTVEIAEMIGVSDPTVGLWLREAGITLRDKRGIYDNKSTRLEVFKELLKLTGKNEKTISTVDFQETHRDDGTAFGGLLGWYRRNHQIKRGAARDLLLQDLCGIEIGESLHYRKLPKRKLKDFEEWDDYQKSINKMFEDHPELNGKFPTTSWLGDNGYYHLGRAARLHGGASIVREKLGQVVLRRSSDYLKDFDNIRVELEKIIKHQLKGEFPTGFWLNSHGYFHLTNALKRHHGGFDEAREKMGYGPSTSIRELENLLEVYVGAVD